MAKKAHAPNMKPGYRFGKLTVVDSPNFCLAGHDKKKRWRVSVQCDCGKQYVTICERITTTDDASCGCHREKKRLTALHKHGECGTRLYVIWSAMKSRCLCRTNDHFKDYGGRGITVTQSWISSFVAFKQWATEAGYNNSSEIDRIENDGNYEPGNCRWVTHSQNNRNKRDNRLLSAFGELKTVSDWIDDPRCQVSRVTLMSRLRYGWSDEKAIATPVMINRLPKNILTPVFTACR